MNYYQTLGISETASIEEIKGAYRKLAKEWHPDKNQSLEATQKMAQINQAYSVLSNPARKDEYDYLHGYGKYQVKNMHAEARKRAQAYKAKQKKAAEDKKKAEEAMSRARAKAREAKEKGAETGKKGKKTEKNAEKHGKTPDFDEKTEKTSGRQFNPNKPCSLCWGKGRVRVAVRFSTAEIHCPKCHGVGS